MKKFAIPALLVATVMVAGMFAFAPVEQASTVHASSTSTLSTTTVALIADDMLELREITQDDIDFNAIQAIRFTGASVSDEFTVLSVIILPGSTGPIQTTDEIDIDGITVDGTIGYVTPDADNDTLAGGIEIISTNDIEAPTGNIIEFEMSSGADPPSDGENINIIAKILIRNSASDPVISTE